MTRPDRWLATLDLIGAVAVASQALALAERGAGSVWYLVAATCALLGLGIAALLFGK